MKLLLETPDEGRDENYDKPVDVAEPLQHRRIMAAYWKLHRGGDGDAAFIAKSSWGDNRLRAQGDDQRGTRFGSFQERSLHRPVGERSRALTPS